MLVRDLEEFSQKPAKVPYLDKSNTLQHKELTETINGKSYKFEKYWLQRGVMVEQYNQLYFYKLYNDSYSIYPVIDQNGKIDLAKALLVGSEFKLKDISTEDDYKSFLMKVRFRF